ncbi:response regulator transcription factor [Hymenobacter glaciei]|uniref:Response regulator transcription factor n=1 Tax=Hymenobacter glaciei TaxID=877209 RepID=A0ABP7U9U9_9BACT
MFPSTPTALVAAVPSLLRQGLVATLRERWPALHLTLTADATQVADLVAQAAFGLVVLDGALPGHQLGQLLGRLYGIRPAQRLVVLTDQHLLPSPSAAATPLQLPRHIPPQALMAALASWLDTPTTGAAPYGARPKAMVEPFSPRELQVLRLVVADHCNEEIADHLCLSVRTVESHRRTLLHKAGTRTLVGLAVRAVREGWVA